MAHPMIIQGGMGAGVSDWRLAKSVSVTGNLGVVSATAMDVVLARRLQDGDVDGNMRRASEKFPDQEIVKRVFDTYYVEGGIQDNNYKQVPMYRIEPSAELVELSILANFIEVTLAKENHDGVVGVNLLEKVQMPTVHALYGVMLAGVDYVIVGAGIPKEIPGILDQLAEGKDIAFKLTVEGAGPDDDYRLHFSPSEFMGKNLASLNRPKFLAIVSSNILATTLVKKSSGVVDGLIIEGYSAGGHNAPPRVKNAFKETGEPLYGEKDTVDFAKLAKLNVPFWIGGGFGTREKLQEALSLGAAGIQVGTAFAFCEESGFMSSIKRSLIEKAKEGIGRVFTDPLASPTGFPFKVVDLEGSLSDMVEYLKRPRICNIGCLQHIFKKDDGEIGYRCPAEGEKTYVAKGGNSEDLKGRKCLCNALISNIGFPKKYKNGYVEQTLITVGDCFNSIKDFLPTEEDVTYFAADVIEKIMPFKGSES